jgi:hypothetical protein
MPTRRIARALATLIVAATPAVFAAEPAAHSTVAGQPVISPIPNYPNPQFDPQPDFPTVRTAYGVVEPIPNYPNPQFDPQS